VKVTPPITITPAMLTTPAVAEPDTAAGEVAWNAATAYTTGALAVRTTTHRVYERLAPGGLLIIGNMNEIELSNLWPMEFLTDWHLFYRTDAEMLAWTEGMQNKERAWTECEPTDRVRLLYVRKGA